MENKQSLSQKFSAFLGKNMPPGKKTERWVKGYVIGLTISLLRSFDFLMDYHNAYENLFQWSGGDKKVLWQGAIMPDFVEILGESLGWFFGYCILFLAAVVWNYLYYYQDSKSIYLMKRLPNPLELHRRAWTLPLIAVGTTILFSFVVLVLYFGIYMIFTPEECILPGQWNTIWR